MRFSAKRMLMKQLFRLAVPFLTCGTLALTAAAGPEALPQDGKESKEMVAPPPPPGCDWTGFYIGLHAGGQFGHSEDVDHDYNVGFANVPPNKPWGYSESGFVGGGQVGYNWQWRWLVLGTEIDAGYMNLDGSGIEPGSPVEVGAPNGDTRGRSDSDFYTTFRGRLGLALNCWLIYATGGAIGVNYETRVDDNTEPVLLHASKTEFDWGYTVGGGIERKIGRHWSVKAEYLYFNLDDQSFSGTDSLFGNRFDFRGETEGHIVRGGLNYKF
jgi:outer membrane immunogenic protein